MALISAGGRKGRVVLVSVVGKRERLELAPVFVVGGAHTNYQRVGRLSM